MAKAGWYASPRMAGFQKELPACRCMEPAADAAMQASANANHQMQERLEQVATSPTTSPAMVLDAKMQLRRIADNDKDLAAAQDAVVGQMQDKKFIAGFGSNGGEEFLS
jgi:hypothetical protein